MAGGDPRRSRCASAFKSLGHRTHSLVRDLLHCAVDIVARRSALQAAFDAIEMIGPQQLNIELLPKGALARREWRLWHEADILPGSLFGKMSPVRRNQQRHSYAHGKVP